MKRNVQTKPGAAKALAPQARSARLMATSATPREIKTRWPPAAMERARPSQLGRSSGDAQAATWTRDYRLGIAAAIPCLNNSSPFQSGNCARKLCSISPGVLNLAKASMAAFT